ncbi:MAG TPA: hypothetical protein VKR06_11600 [Ktedonosporobacter sp.]|nr:hypothetical protein [Ktedonosporobacter sp.]
MKEVEPQTTSLIPTRRKGVHWLKGPLAPSCSICTRRVWLNLIHLTEPAGAPEPHLSWILCKSCHQALQAEMRRSPLLSPLRLRIAIGIVASERWPEAHPTRTSTYLSDRKWFIWMAVLFFVTMILHLVVIVGIAALAK